jgi:Xaa-Pro aminopeptidase
LRFANWQDYIDPELLEIYRRTTGRRVSYSTYASNDELADRLALAGVSRRRGRKPEQYDLIVPSDSLFRELLNQDRLAKLDTSIVTTALLGNLDMAVYTDPKWAAYGIPWATGMTGIGYDSDVFDEPPTWSVFADVAYEGKATLLDEMRLFKDAHEQDIMRRASAISAQAHIRAMQRSARMLRAGEDVREYHLDAELLHAFRDAGSQYPAYSSIVAAGANACVLHYRADAAPVRDGELVLIDAGCELDGYASDITRTFPANGRFTGPQRALYDLVLASQEAAIAATRAGARFTDPHEATVKVLAQGMLDVGLLDRNTVGTVDDVIASRAYFQFYMHRTGHWLGMDVHDCGSYVEPSEVGQTSQRQDPLSGETITNRPSRILRPGMVLTIEPGLYVRPAEGVPEAFWNLGIRIEDDAVVTEGGCELITRGVPVAADAIEALMRD